MTGESVCWLPIDELTRCYRAGELSPVDVTRALLDRIGELNGTLESFLLVLEAEALCTAGESERRHRAGSPRGPLDGVPISVKDIFHVAGHPTTAGSSILAGHRATEDSAVVGRLGATGGPLCDPGSWLQPHGLWHISAAAALGWWAVAAPRVR